MAGYSCLPSASAQIWRIAVFDNTPVVIDPAVGPACLAGPFARPLADPLRGGGGSGGMTSSGVALSLSLLQAGYEGPGSADLPGGCGMRSLRFFSCPTPWAAKASLYSLGVRCTCRVG